MVGVASLNIKKQWEKNDEKIYETQNYHFKKNIKKIYYIIKYQFYNFINYRMYIIFIKF